MCKFRNIPIYSGNTDPQDMAGGWGVLAPKLLFSCIPRTIGSDQGCLTLLPSYCQKPCNWIKYPLAPEAWFVRLAPVMRSHSSRPNEMLCLWSSFCQGESLSLAPQGCASVGLNAPVLNPRQCVCWQWAPLPSTSRVCHGLWWFGDVVCVSFVHHPGFLT